MSEHIFKILKNSYFGQQFLTMKYLPRWIVFAIDIGIVFFASLVTFFIVNGLTIKFYDNLNIAMRHSLILAANALFFLLFKSYSGIIRHSTFIDAVKLLSATTCAFLFLAILNYSNLFLFDTKIYLTTWLFICYVISFLLLFLFRIMVKYVFENYTSNNNSKTKLTKTVIYGSDANAISVANALKIESPSRFKLLAFIDKNNLVSGSKKRILNLPILNHSKQLSIILKELETEALIITDKSLTKKETIVIVNECLENNVKVFTVPVISDWQDKNQIANKITNFKIEDLLDRKPITLDNNSISEQLLGKTILITGAAGSIGSEITRQILKFEPRKIIILDHAETPLHNLTLELNQTNSKVKIRNILADIKDAETLETIFRLYKPEIVYHAAAYKHVPLMEENPCQAVATNIIGTKNLADLSQKYNIQRFVMVSTDKAVNPSSVMGASKRIAEKYVQSLSLDLNKNNNFKTKFITTRFGNVLGSNGSIVPLFTKQIQEGGPITITHPEIIRYFMTIPEACQLVLEAGAMGNGSEIFIFDMGQPVKILDLANKMIQLAGFTPDNEIKIEIIGLRPGEKLYEELLNDDSKTLPTHNEKILIAQDVCDNYEALNQEIQELEAITKTFSGFEIVSKMKKIVPEFKSMNSIYVDLDTVS